MALYSNQQWFCNICGKEQNSPLPNAIGGYTKCKVCSMECLREYQWREVLSIMGKEYYPNPSEHTAKY